MQHKHNLGEKIVKTRVGFVSNSSSASFVLQKKHLTQAQVDAIHQHIDYALKHHIPCGKVDGFGYDKSDRWNITENATEFRGWTSMDNFFFDIFLHAIGVAANDYVYDGEPW